MSPDKAAKLVEAFPVVYKDNQLVFGIECGDGWYELLYKLSKDLTAAFENRTLEEKNLKITVLQIKEKFGGLRFYYAGGNAKTDQLIAEAERESYSVCERCGKEATRTTNTGWIQTLCETCIKLDE